MDRSVRPVELIMMRPKDAPPYPRIELPEGYRFTDTLKDPAREWCDLQLAADHVENIEHARRAFADNFAGNIPLLIKNSAMIVSNTGELVGIATLWPGTHFGPKAPYRVHWVAVSTAHQGKGLGKALMTRLMDINAEIGNTEAVYLTTQTESYRAIGIYLKFGFEPDTKTRLDGWPDEEEAEIGWEIVRNKLGDGRGSAPAPRLRDQSLRNPSN